MQIETVSTAEENVSANSADVSESEEQEQSASADADETSEESETSKAEDADEESESEANDKEVAQEPKKKGGFQKRIDKLTKRVSERERELEYWKQEAMKKATGASQETKESVQAPRYDYSSEKPSLDSFETHAEYIEALTDWKLEQRDRDQQLKQRQSEIQTSQQQKADAYKAKIQEFRKTCSDFDEVVEEVAEIPLSLALEELLLDSPIGAQLSYELAKNKEELLRLNSLSPMAAAREIGKLEHRLNTSESKPVERKLTKAPAPLATVGKGSASIAKAINDPTLSFAEYEKLRLQQLKSKQ